MVFHWGLNPGQRCLTAADARAASKAWADTRVTCKDLSRCGCGQACDSVPNLSSQSSTVRGPGISTVTWSLVGLGRNQVAAAFWRKTPMQMPSLTVGKRAKTSSTGKWIQSALSRRSTWAAIHLSLGTFGLHRVGAPWGGTLSTTKDAQGQCPVWPAKVPTWRISVVLVYENHLIPSPFSGCGPIAAQLDPWCRTSLWPDCTLSGGACARTSTAGWPSR